MPNAEIGAVPAVRGVNGSGEIHDVTPLAHLDPDGDADVGGASELVASEAGANVARTAVLVHGAVVGANPVRGVRRHGVPGVERDERLVGVAVLGELQPDEASRLHVPEPWIHEDQQRERGVVGHEARGNARDRREVGAERIDLQRGAEPCVPELLGLSGADVVGLAGDAARGDAADELLELVPEAGAVKVEGEKFGNLSGGDVCHERLQFLTPVPTPCGSESGYSENRTDVDAASLGEFPHFTVIQV